jgi:hypothetical protein
MEMTATENSVELRLSTAGENDTKLFLYPAPSARRNYIPVAVEFFFRPHRLEAKMSIGESPQNVTGSLKLPNIVAGEGTIRLGGDPGIVSIPARTNPKIEKGPTPEIPDEIPAENLFSEITGEISERAEETEPAPAADTTLPESPAETGKKVAQVTVWNEFAVLYSRLPLLPEEDVITAKSEDTGSENTEEQKQIPVSNPAGAVTRMNSQTESEEIPIAAEQAKPDPEISAPSEEETRVFADYQEDLPTDDVPEVHGESEYSDEDWEYPADYSTDISGDL